MPLRRRRDGAAVQARTEEQSSARVRVPARQKAPWPIRRRGASRRCVQDGPRLARRGWSPSRTPDGSSRRPGCPECNEEGTRDIVQERAARLHSSAPARDLPCPRKWSTVRASHREQVVARRPPMRRRIAEADATGIGWCRRAAGRKPHSRARIEGSTGVPARRFRLQKSASDAEAQRSVTPLAAGRVDGGPASRGSARIGGR